MVASLLGVFLSHASSAVFLSASLAFFLVFLGFEKKNYLHVLGSLFALAFLFFNSLTDPMFRITENAMSSIVFGVSNVFFQFAYLITIPLALYGFLAFRKERLVLYLLLSFICASALLGFFSTPNWSWRFFLDGFWICLAGILSAALSFSKGLAQPKQHLMEKMKSGLILSALVFVLLIFIPYSSFAVIQDMKPSYTLDDIATLSIFVNSSRLLVYLPFDDNALKEILLRIDKTARMYDGICPSDAPDGSWMIKPAYEVNFASKEDEKLFQEYVASIYSNGRAYSVGRFDFIKCGE